MKNLLVTLLLLLSAPLFGQDFYKKISPNLVEKTFWEEKYFTNYEIDLFGFNHSLSNKTLVIGAYDQDYDSIGGDSLHEAGAAYVFYRDTCDWKFVKKLTGASAGINGRVENDRFGYSVDIFGDFIIVGAFTHDYNSVGGDSIASAGAAYIFQRNKGGADNWGLVKKLTGEWAGLNGRMRADYFGEVVEIGDGVAAVYVNGNGFDIPGEDEFIGMGSVYLFAQNKGGPNNWGFLKKITGEGAGFLGRHKHDRFGYSLSISEDILAIGSSRHEFGATNLSHVDGAGAVFIFQKDKGGVDNWGFVKKLATDLDPTKSRKNFDEFGVGLDLHKGLLAVGAPLQDYNTQGVNKVKNSGAAYLFYRNKGGVDNWGFVKKITSEGLGKNSRNEGDEFGNSVALNDSVLVVGVRKHRYDDTGGYSFSNVGAAFVFKRNKGGIDNWGYDKKLTGGSGEIYDRFSNRSFGSSVSISGEVITCGSIGVLYATGNTGIIVNGFGGVYIYEPKTTKRNNSDSVSITVCDTYLNSKGQIYQAPGIYTDTLANRFNCDSVLTIKLLLSAKNSIDTISTFSCVSYTSPSGAIYTASGFYNDTLYDLKGCDSVVVVDLNLHKFDTTVSIQGKNLVSNDSTSISYQWLDCNNNYLPITGESNRSFTPKKSGSYAVEIALEEDCKDTSECINIVGLSSVNNLEKGFKLYPNPVVADEVTLFFPQTIDNATIKLINIQGKTIFEEKNFSGKSKHLLLTNQSKGVYFIEVINGDSIKRQKLIKL